MFLHSISMILKHYRFEQYLNDSTLCVCVCVYACNCVCPKISLNDIKYS